MPKRSCPDCDRRLPYAGQRCVHCGWSVRAGAQGQGAARRRRGRLVTFALLVLSLLGLGAAFRNADVLSDWYAGFAARHLPARASSFAPSGTGTGAFFYCARQVARRMGELSVETFAGEKDARLVELGADRFRVESSVVEARADGSHVRVDFVCTTRFERGRWVLEELNLPQLAEAR